MHKTLKQGGTFVVEPRRLSKASAELRARGFGEITIPPSTETAEKQASRCTDCGVPFCQNACPLQNNIPDWLRLSAENEPREAWRVASLTSTMPEICGRICPQDRLCEGSCTLNQSGWDAVTIGSVEAWLGDQAFANGWVEPIRPAAERGETVGIVGAGPAGLAAADRLRCEGYQVTIYDRHDRAGGLLIYGIPGFKLEKPIVMARMDQLAAGGVRFVMNCKVGEDMSFADLRARHDALLIATGVYQARDISAPGVGAKGIVQALDYLTCSNRLSFGDTVPEYESGELNAEDKNVVVIGGGDTAMDCVRTAIRQGAKSVKCLYRRDRANMPGSQRETQNAEEEGVEFVWLSAPKGFSGDDKVSGVMVQRMRLGQPDVSGRQSPEVIEGADYMEDADLVVTALGFEPEEIPTLWNVPELEVTRWGTVKADFRTHATNLPGIYAAGDIVRGASLVVWAIRDGREAADAISAYLANQSAKVAAE